MSREDTGKSSIAALTLRLSLVAVTPLYLFGVAIFHPLLNINSFFGKAWWLFIWWLGANIGGLPLCIAGGMFGMRVFCNLVYQTRREYYLWLQAGGDPFWDILPWPINPDPPRVRMAITTPPDYDFCPYDGFPMGRRFGNQCRSCGMYHDKA